MGLKLEGWGFGVCGLEFRILCLGFGVWGLGFDILGFGVWGLIFWGLGFGVWGLGFELMGFGFWDFGFRVSGLSSAGVGILGHQEACHLPFARNLNRTSISDKYSGSMKKNLHAWIILVIVEQHLVQIGRIDGPIE